MTEAAAQGKRATNKEARRRALLDAARQLYAEHGVDNTRMEDVAALAGCTRRTLYAYFDSWDDLCLQVFIEDTRGRWARQTAAMDAVDTGLAKLRAWGEAHWRYSKQNPAHLALQTYRDYRRFELSKHRPEVRESYDSVVNPIVVTMVAVMEQAREEGSVRRDLDLAASMAHYAYSLRSVMHRALSPGSSVVDVEPDAFVRDYIDHFLRGLAPDPEDRK